MSVYPGFSARASADAPLARRTIVRGQHAGIDGFNFDTAFAEGGGRHRASVDEHCTRHPAFCVYGAWELPSAYARDEDPPPGEPTTPDECATGEQYHLREGYWSSFPR